MLGFHSLDPVKLLPGTSSRKTTISRPKHTAAEGTQKTLTNGSVNYHGNNSNLSERDAGPEKTIVPKQETTHESGGYKADGHVATSRHLSDQAKAYTELGLRNEAEAGTASIGWTIRPVKSNPPRPEPPRRSCSSSSLGHDTICIPSRPDESHIEAASTSRPDESSYNMIPYRRDAKLVIAYLVPLPQPNVQSQDGVIPPRYFLYVPPPPHLMKPKRGEEDQVHKLKRLHQQNERRAEPRISNGKWVTARGIHGRMTRTAVRFLDTLKDDNITFLSRVHPRTVRHLVLIHPQGLFTGQTPKEWLNVFRVQMLDSKKKAMRNSIISAAAFLPMLAINTAAMFFAGQAEFASIGLLLSVGAYQVARLVTTKLGPDPKMVDITQEELIDDAQQILGKISKPQQEKERTRLNMDQNSSEREKGDDGSPVRDRELQNHRAWIEDTSGRVGIHQVNRQNIDPVAGGAAEGLSFPSRTGHAETKLYTVPPGSTKEEKDTSRTPPKVGQDFKLTFYPSPAMKVMAQYLQEICHSCNSHVFPSPGSVPSEQDVLAVLGWEPEPRRHETHESQAEDDEAREIPGFFFVVKKKIELTKAWQ